jgi:hypothetical protein
MSPGTVSVETRPSIPIIRTALFTRDQNLQRIWAETDAIGIGVGGVPADADVVMVDASALREAPEVEAAILSWAAEVARQPLIMYDPTGSHPASQIADVVLDAAQIETFDPMVANPMGNRAHLLGDAELAKSEVRKRRQAFRHRAPWVLAHQFLDEVGVFHPSPEPIVAGLLVSMRPDDLRSAIERFGAQDYPTKELVVVCHGFDSSSALSELESHDMQYTLLQASSSDLLGDCLNLAAAATSASVLSKIDDDDHYGPGFLTDAVDALGYAQADIVGKSTQFTYVQSADLTVLRHPGSEEMFVPGAVAGGSLVFHRRVWEDVGFPSRPRRVDALFLRGARARGASVYANSRWDFVYNRRSTDQTWRADDNVFLAGSEAAWDGNHPTYADA